ncbi:MAG: DNA double-strand break repair nuclease NurA [Thermoplasmata archaeon]|nr:DNA double-strand break repair nuclease NurA [Thermoplasmata archaeon]
MTLNLLELATAIEKRLPELKELSIFQREYSELGKELIDQIGNKDFLEFSALLPPSPAGAIPILEGNEKEGNWRFIRKFKPEFESLVEAKNWAKTVLSGRAVGAVDGSQIYPGNALTLPLGMVNIGWYINYHDGHYELQHESSFLLPDELGYNPDSGVSLCREEAEVDKLIELLGRLNENDLVFLDGSLVLSFALHVFETERKRYIEAVLRLLQASEKTEGPFLAGYIDNSRATDISTMFSSLISIHLSSAGLKDAQRPSDASLISYGMQWGDRTAAFICARDDILNHYRQENRDYSRDIAFFYIKASHGGISRVEFPRRIVEEGKVGLLADIVRAQTIVGDGYPHALNRAHHEAVVSIDKREKFIGILRCLSERHDLGIGTSLKAVKKRI